MTNVIRPSGYTGQTLYLDYVSEPVPVTAHLWGGGGGGGGGGPGGSSRIGGDGAGGSYARVSFELLPTDVLEIAVGGGGLGGGKSSSVNRIANGGAAGAGFVLGPWSFSGGSGGYGTNSGGGGGGGGATALFVNGVLLAVAAGGAGGGGRAAKNGNPFVAPGPAGLAPTGVYPGQNGQNMNVTGGGGGGGSAGVRGGHGGAANGSGGDGAAGSNGSSFSATGITASSSGRTPGNTSQIYYDGMSGRGGTGGQSLEAGAPGITGFAVLEFAQLPGFYVRTPGDWEFVKNTYAKYQGQWREVKTTYVKTNGVWLPTLASVAPNLLTVLGKFGVNSRPYPDPRPEITALSWIPGGIFVNQSSVLSWQAEFAEYVDYVVDFTQPPPPPEPPSQQITGTFERISSVTVADGALTQDRVKLCVTGPSPGLYRYTITSNPAVTFTQQTGGLQGTTTGTINWPPSNPVTVPGSQTFSATGAVQFFTVPQGVTTIQVVLTGGGGGAGNRDDDATFSTLNYGKPGDVVSGAISVIPGESLQIYVGGGGSGGTWGSRATPGRPGGFGFGSGGASGNLQVSGQGGGGGGASAIVRAAGNVVLAVAAGGGGGGGNGGTRATLASGDLRPVGQNNGGDGANGGSDTGTGGGGGGGFPGGVGGLLNPGTGDRGAQGGSSGKSLVPSGGTAVPGGGNGGQLGSSRDGFAMSGGPGSVTLSWTATIDQSGDESSRCVIAVLNTPHPATTLRATIERDGRYIPFVATLAVPLRQPGETILGAGTHTFVVPPYSSKLEVMIIGGGGGGTGSAAGSGGVGKQTAIAALSMTANGGAGSYVSEIFPVQAKPGGSASGGTSNITGNPGNSTNHTSLYSGATGGLAGSTQQGSITVPTTVGQGGTSGSTFAGPSWVYAGSGAGGGTAYKSFPTGGLVPGTSLSVTVGTGGNGTGGQAGQAGIAVFKWD